MMNRKGSIVAYTAVALTAMVGFAGFAVDLQRSWLVQTRLKTALDAAALSAARDFDSANRDTNARAAFTANLNPGGGTNDVFGASVSTPVVEQIGDNQIRVTATATVQNSLFRVFSSAPVMVTDSSLAARAATGMELAIVLDQTGSMGQADSATGTTKIESAKAAINTMLGVLYGSADTQRNLWVSLVPFARTINIGTSVQARNMLNTSTPAMPAGWNIDSWGGCVEARTGGEDITDTGPATLAGRFRPYFWPDTYRQMGSVEGGQCLAGRAYPLTGGTRWCHGDNDWGLVGTANAAQLAGNPHFTALQGAGLATPFSPNTLCATNPVLPLTASRATVAAAVNAVTAPGRSGGTTIAPGLQGGWLTLSPNWRGFWPNATASLPLDYGTRNMRKVVVLLSDGDNNWQGSTAVYPSRNGGELFYNAYGRLADNRLPITPVAGDYSQTARNADTALDTRWSSLCTAMKAAPYNITIYVIGFEVANGTHRNLLRNCASSTAHYFESPSASDLQATFRRVGSALASLRLAE
ncbi:MAG: hypothetical protein K2X74_12010 [Acetobacteraceae bacterium]|nr:hypothetical protein [Acetobacteraceae bacterium]